MVKGGKRCRSLYLRVAWLPCVSELYACWRQQLPLLQLELAWELLFECTTESGGKKKLFFSQKSDNACDRRRGRRGRRVC